MVFVRGSMAMCGRGSATRRAAKALVSAGVLAWAALVQPDASGAAPRAYGSAGSFQASPAHIDAVEVPGWAFDPGQAAYFPAVTRDGTIFVANLPQTFNQMLPTACSMVITCFNPDQPVCDDGAGGGAFFSNLHIPNIAGAVAEPEECPLSHRLASFPSGADISDLEVIEDPDVEGGERVAFASAWGSSTGRRGFPAFGSLVKRGGLWTVDFDARRWSDDLHRSSAAGAAACPATSDGDAWCGSFSEMERLPRSGRLVIGQYATPGLIVTDGHGVVLAQHTFEPLTDPTGAPVVRLPREIDVDPSSAPRDERFVVIFDSPNGRGQPLQEFSYDDVARTLVPTSAPVAPQSGVHPVPGKKQHQMVLAQYDTDGNLWVVHGPRVDAGALVGFVKSRTTGRREALEGACGPRDAEGKERPWGSPCSADLDAGLSGSLPLFVNLVEDTKTGTLLGVGWGGTVWRLERTPSRGGLAVTWASRADLFFDDLQPRGAGEFRSASKGIVDDARRLWVPVSTGEQVVPAGCGFMECDPVTGARRSQYLYELDLGGLPDRPAHVTHVTVPESVVEGRSFQVRIDATLAGSFDRRGSAFSLFDEKSDRPIVTRAWRRRCAANECRFAVKVPARFTEGRGGSVLSWHAFLADATGESLHTAGVVSIVR
jgi:hypothetical protein